MMFRVVPIGDRTLGLPLQLTPKVQRPICLFETHVEEAQDSCSNHVWLGRGPPLWRPEGFASRPYSHSTASGQASQLDCSLVPRADRRQISDPSSYSDA